MLVERLLPEIFQGRQHDGRFQRAIQFEVAIEGRTHSGSQLRQGRNVLKAGRIDGATSGDEFGVGADQLQPTGFAHFHTDLDTPAQIFHELEIFVEDLNL